MFFLIRLWFCEYNIIFCNSLNFLFLLWLKERELTYGATYVRRCPFCGAHYGNEKPFDAVCTLHFYVHTAMCGAVFNFPLLKKHLSFFSLSFTTSFLFSKNYALLESEKENIMYISNILKNSYISWLCNSHTIKTNYTKNLMGKSVKKRL